uniref:Uncharacterized protein n=1 Tax=Glossina austeni TaxID=7395 RepID=A0A1A9V4A6_GLOAU
MVLSAFYRDRECKFLLIGLALISTAVAVLLDSATQGPNPQDIATPEPEYVDFEVPEIVQQPSLRHLPTLSHKSDHLDSYDAQQIFSNSVYHSHAGYQYRSPLRRTQRRLSLSISSDANSVNTYFDGLVASGGKGEQKEVPSTNCQQSTNEVQVETKKKTLNTSNTSAV